MVKAVFNFDGNDASIDDPEILNRSGQIVDAVLLPDVIAGEDGDFYTITFADGRKSSAWDHELTFTVGGN